MGSGTYISKFIAWVKDRAKSNIADLDFDIPNKKNENYSRLLLLRELRIDLLQINDIINYHIEQTKLIRREKCDRYRKREETTSTILFFWETTSVVEREYIAKLTLRDVEKKSKFFFRINNFRDSATNQLSLDVSFFPTDKDKLLQCDKSYLDIYEFDELFNNWINNLRLFNNFSINEFDSEKLIEDEFFFSGNSNTGENLSDLEVGKLVTFLNNLKLLIQTKETSRNSEKINKLILEIDFIKDNLTNFSKKKIKFYLNVLAKKIIRFVKDISWELIKETIARGILGPG